MSKKVDMSHHKQKEQKWWEQKKEKKSNPEIEINKRIKSIRRRQQRN